MKEKILLSSSDLIENSLGKLLVEKDFFLSDNLTLFESKLESYLGSKKKIATVNSGTSAIHLSLILADVKKDDLVICQSFTYIATVNPILYLGATPVFVDSEKDTWNMCPLALEDSLVDLLSKGIKPKAIIVVHSYGMPAKIDQILAISKKYDIVLIEDAAEALGSTYKGQKCGTFGDFGIISFNENKIISTSGGGALVCKNEEDKQKAIFLATQARDEAPHYQHSEIGYNYRMSNISAGIGRGQMEVLDDHVHLRRSMHHFYKDLFKNNEGITVFAEPNKNYFSNHWLSCIFVDDSITGFTREDIRIKLLEENIETRPLWKPMHIQPLFNHASYYGGKVAENLFKKGLCLPSGSNLTEKDKNRISTAIKYFLS